MLDITCKFNLVLAISNGWQLVTLRKLPSNPDMKLINGLFVYFLSSFEFIKY
jgi:hypothetical protein